MCLNCSPVDDHLSRIRHYALDSLLWIFPSSWPVTNDFDGNEESKKCLLVFIHAHEIAQSQCTHANVKCKRKSFFIFHSKSEIKIFDQLKFCRDFYFYYVQWIINIWFCYNFCYFSLVFDSMLWNWKIDPLLVRSFQCKYCYCIQ